MSHDLYFKWLEDELPNATACLKASTKITVNEAYDLTGLWVRHTLRCCLNAGLIYRIKKALSQLRLIGICSYGLSFQGVFVLFLGGLVVASLVLMTEVCVAVVADWM